MADFIAVTDKTKHLSCNACYWRIEDQCGFDPFGFKKSPRKKIPCNPELVRCTDFSNIKANCKDCTYSGVGIYCVRNSWTEPFKDGGCEYFSKKGGE